MEQREMGMRAADVDRCDHGRSGHDGSGALATLLVESGISGAYVSCGCFNLARAFLVVDGNAFFGGLE